MNSLEKIKLMRIVSLKFRVQQSSLYSTSEKNDIYKSAKQKSTIDQQDVNFMSQFDDKWWDPNGTIKILHAMNPLRVQLIREGLASTGFKETNMSRPLEGVKILDVGCGGGILSETLARNGAEVTGLDASKELLVIAQNHAKLDSNLSSNLTYVNSSIEEYSRDKKENYDVVMASEVIEHVNNQELFLKECTEVLKPNGSIFVTTFNRNYLSWLTGIIGAEYIMRIIPKGTHDWNKFIKPEETSRLLQNYNCNTKMVKGMLYNPMTIKWSWMSSTLVTYALHAVKTKVN